MTPEKRPISGGMRPSESSIEGVPSFSSAFAPGGKRTVHSDDYLLRGLVEVPGESDHRPAPVAGRSIAPLWGWCIIAAAVTAMLWGLWVVIDGVSLLADPTARVATLAIWLPAGVQGSPPVGISAVFVFFVWGTTAVLYFYAGINLLRFSRRARRILLALAALNVGMFVLQMVAMDRGVGPVMDNLIFGLLQSALLVPPPIRRAFLRQPSPPEEAESGELSGDGDAVTPGLAFSGRPGASGAVNLIAVVVPYPLRPIPQFDERPWGNQKLKTLLGKPIPADVPIGESWEVSGHPFAPTIVANGDLRGRLLNEVMVGWGEWLLGPMRRPYPGRIENPVPLALPVSSKPLPPAPPPSPATPPVVDDDDAAAHVEAGAGIGVSAESLVTAAKPVVMDDDESVVRFEWRFPLLAKYLSTEAFLSVQVHPGDFYDAHGNLIEPGKTEAWVILDAEPGAFIYQGFTRDMTPHEIQTAAKSGTLPEYLRKVPVRAGDVVLNRAGVIHALGPGLVLVEIQQVSDVTYRLFDFGRVGRKLHLEPALRVMRLDAGVPDEPPLPAPTISVQHPSADRVVACEYFQIWRLTLPALTATTAPRPTDFAYLRGSAYAIVHHVEGSPATLRWANGQEKLTLGDSLILPAAVLDAGVWVSVPPIPQTVASAQLLVATP